jgi:hypothetical protein
VMDTAMAARIRERRHTPVAPIAWLPVPITLLSGGRGPLVVGVAEDAVMGKRKFQQLSARAEREAADVRH